MPTMPSLPRAATPPGGRLPVLLSPLGASFRCSTCGDCCRGPGEIPVQEHEAAAIRQALERHPHPAGSPAALVPPAEAAPGARLARGADGACVFLEPDNRCYLHRHFGPELKPAACRTYPFRPVERPGAVVAPASLSCRSLRQGLARITAARPAALVPAETPELAALAALPHPRYGPGTWALLGPGQSLRIEALQQIEEKLAALLGEPRLGPWQRLLSMRYLVEALRQGGQERLGMQSLPPACAAALGPELRTARHRAAAAGPDLEAHLRLLGCVLDRMAETGGAEVAARQARQFGAGLHLPPASRARVALSIYHARDTVERPEHLALLLTFLGEHLRASPITARHGLLCTVQALVVAAALVRYLACGRAGERQRAATQQDILGAIEEVERLLFDNPAVEALLCGPGGEALGTPRAAEVLLLLPPPGSCDEEG